MKKRSILIVATILLITVLATCLVACGGGTSPQKDNAKVTEENAKKIKDGKYTLEQCKELLGEPTYYTSDDTYCWVKEEKKFIDYAKDNDGLLLFKDSMSDKSTGVKSRFDTEEFTLNGRKSNGGGTVKILWVSFYKGVIDGVSFDGKKI